MSNRDPREPRADITATLQPAIDKIPDAIKAILDTIPQTFVDLLSELVLEEIPAEAV